MELKFTDKEIQDRFDQITPEMKLEILRNMEFKTLYKKTSTGANQQWRISVNGCEITTEYGKVGGKLITSHETIKEGKNFGKKNGTLPEEQALLEAQSTYIQKLKKGYVESLDDAEAGVTDAIIEGGMFPMLAHKYSEQGHKIVYPALVQPKFDGHRCIAIRDNGVWGLWSRTRKPITGLPHIIKALEDYTKSGGEDYIFDGELYNHDYKSKFEELTHFIRQEIPISGHEVVQYHVYDIAHPGLFNSKRGSILLKLGFQNPLVKVQTLVIVNEDDLMEFFGECLKLGYEGAMVRNLNAYYVNKRSYDLLKIKEFQEKDYKIIGVEEGKGIMAGKAIFKCITESGSEFRAKMVGALSDLEKYITNPELAIGKMLEVKLQGYTSKNQVPRFPVGVRIKTDL